MPHESIHAHFAAKVIQDTLQEDIGPLVDKFTYVKMDRDIKSCKNFVQLYKIYRDQVKDADKEVGNIIDSYEGIIKTKDEAYNTVLKEYYTLNELLDKSIKQTNDAVITSKSSLTT